MSTQTIRIVKYEAMMRRAARKIRHCDLSNRPSSSPVCGSCAAVGEQIRRDLTERLRGLQHPAPMLAAAYALDAYATARQEAGTQ